MLSPIPHPPPPKKKENEEGKASKQKNKEQYFYLVSFLYCISSSNQQITQILINLDYFKISLFARDTLQTMLQAFLRYNNSLSWLHSAFNFLS